MQGPSMFQYRYCLNDLRVLDFPMSCAPFKVHPLGYDGAFWRASGSSLPRNPHAYLSTFMQGGTKLCFISIAMKPVAE